MKGTVLFLAVCIGIVPLAVAGTFVVPVMLRAMAIHKIQTSGIPAIGTVLSIADSGTKYNYQPVYNIQLQITPASGPAFTSMAQIALNPANLAQIQPGQQLPVKYSAGNHSQAVIATAP